MRPIRRRGGCSSEHDRRCHRPDHRRTQRSRIAPRLRGSHRSRLHRTDHGRHDQAARRARPHHRQRPPSAERGHSNARHAYPPHPNPRQANPPDPHPRLPNPSQPNARPPSPHRTTHRRPLLGPLHRVMDRCRRLAPEVVRSHRTRHDPAGRGRGSVTLLRRPRSERNELLPRPEPVSREVDDVRFPVAFLACLVVGSVVLHGFADLFPAGRGVRVLPAR